MYSSEKLREEVKLMRSRAEALLGDSTPPKEKFRDFLLVFARDRVRNTKDWAFLDEEEKALVAGEVRAACPDLFDS
jgi:hypothetical protein